MQNRYLILLIALLSIQLASADILISYPSNLTVNTGISRILTINLQNTYDFSVFDFKFSNTEGFIFENITLAPNETKTVSFSVLRSTPGSFNINSEMSFKYMVDIPQGLHTYQVNITPSSGLSPNDLTVRKGDTVIWYNLDSINREISSTLFDFIIAPNGSNSFTFANTGDISYQDLTLFYGATIRVINETELTPVNNPALNKMITIALNVVTAPTYLTILNSNDNYTINSTSSSDGLLTLTNTGTETANQVQLRSIPTWVLFESNNFNIAPGQTKYIVYHVQPSLFKIDDTNKSYTINLAISGLNINSSGINLNVFVPYDSSLGTLETNEGFLAFFKRFCLQNPNLIICNNSISSGNNGTTTVRDPLIQGNITFSQLMEALRRIQSLDDKQARTDSKINDLAVSLQETNPTIIAIANESLQKQYQNESKSIANQWIFWLTIMFGGLIVGTVIVFMIIKKHKDSANLYSGGYDFKWK